MDRPSSFVFGMQSNDQEEHENKNSAQSLNPNKNSDVVNFFSIMDKAASSFISRSRVRTSSSRMSGPQTSATNSNKLLNEWVWVSDKAEHGYVPARVIDYESIDTDTINPNDMIDVEVFFTYDSLSKRLSLPFQSLVPMKDVRLAIAAKDLSLLPKCQGQEFEATVLSNLQYRFLSGDFHTWIGTEKDILLSINPQEIQKELGDDEVIGQSSHRSHGDPSIFEIMKQSYLDMLTGGNDNDDQSIITLGETGTGKSQCFQQCLKQLIKVNEEILGRQSRDKDSLPYQVKDTLLDRVAILDAFGSISTPENSSSSRFAKWVEVHFNKETKEICGARLSTLMLEKTQILNNTSSYGQYFNVFYQVLSDPDILSKFLEAITSISSEIDEVLVKRVQSNDKSQFEALCHRFDKIGLDTDHQEWLFDMILCIFFLRELKFSQSSDSSGERVEINNRVLFNTIADILAVDVNELEQLMLNRIMVVKGEKSVIRLSMTDVLDSRDHLSTYLYGKLFDHMVQVTNKSINGTMSKFVALLDSPGFENIAKTESNSLEQLCRNYASETFQSHMVNFVADEEKKFYTTNSIPMFPSDFDCFQNIHSNTIIELFEGKPNGIMFLLEEESRYPGASDTTLHRKLEKAVESCPIARGNKLIRYSKSLGFSIEHYAGNVIYNTESFLSKNKDSINYDLEILCSKSNNDKLKGLFDVESIVRTSNSNQLANHKAKTTGQVRSSVSSLISLINLTRSRFIYCMKPTFIKQQGVIHGNSLLSSLNVSSLLNIAIVRAKRFPYSMSYEDFVYEYGVISPRFSEIRNSNSKCERQVVSDILKRASRETSIQLGPDQVFFRDEVYSNLEQLRKQKEETNAVLIQKVVRGHMKRNFFHAIVPQVRSILNEILSNQSEKTLDEVQNHLKSCEQILGTHYLSLMNRYPLEEMEKVERINRLLSETHRICDKMQNYLHSSALEQDENLEYIESLYERFEQLLKLKIFISEAQRETGVQLKQYLKNREFSYLDRMADDALSKLDKAQMLSIIEDAERFGYSSSSIVAIQSIAHLKDEEFCKLQFNKAHAVGDKKMVREFERKLLDNSLKANESLFQLWKYSKLRDPAVWMQANGIASSQKLSATSSATDSMDCKYDSMLSWTNKPIQISLVNFNQKLLAAEYVKILERDSLKMFTELMTYMGDKTGGSSTLEAAATFLTRALACPQLRTEALLQIIKQIMKNPTPSSKIRGWEMLGMSVSLTPVDPDFENFLVVWIRSYAEPEFAKKCVDFIRSHGEEINGAKKVMPSAIQSSAILELRKQFTRRKSGRDSRGSQRRKKEEAINNENNGSSAMNAQANKGPSQFNQFKKQLSKLGSKLLKFGHPKDSSNVASSSSSFKKTTNGTASTDAIVPTVAAMVATTPTTKKNDKIKSEEHNENVQSGNKRRQSNHKTKQRLSNSALALYDFNPRSLDGGNDDFNGAISIRKGEKIEILQVEDDWLLARKRVSKRHSNGNKLKRNIMKDMSSSSPSTTNATTNDTPSKNGDIEYKEGWLPTSYIAMNDKLKEVVDQRNDMR